jgi:hypothetical protein
MATTQPSEVRPRQAGMLTANIPQGAGDRASAQDEGSGGTGIGALRAAAEIETASLEARSGNWWQSERFPRQQAVRGRPTRREANSCGVVAIAVGAAVAAMGARFGGFDWKGHLGRHQASLDERHAHPERQEKRQEQSSEPMLRRRVHDWYYGAVRSRQQGSLQAGLPVLLTMTLDRVGQPT